MAGTSTRMPVCSGAGPFTQVCALDFSPGVPRAREGQEEALLLIERLFIGVSELPKKVYRIRGWTGQTYVSGERVHHFNKFSKESVKICENRRKCGFRLWLD